MEIKKKYMLLAFGIIIGIVITIFVYPLFNGTNTYTNKINIDKIKKEKHVQITTVKLTDNVLKEFNIIIKTTGPGKIIMHKDLTGEIVPNPYKVAHIIPRFTGVVKKIYKKIGDKIKKGETIAVIESNESLVQYKVKSSIDGTILMLHMTPGELIGDDKHAITVADLSSVWASLIVYQKDLTKIKVGQNVEISTIDESKVTKSKIFYVSPIVDEETRTLTAQVRLNNTSGFWKPGMFIISKVFTSSKKVPLVVNRNALQFFKGETVVFIQNEKGFRPQPVSLGLENNEYVEILSGLKQGQKYAAEGAFTIKSEFLKESFEGGH